MKEHRKGWQQFTTRKIISFLLLLTCCVSAKTQSLSNIRYRSFSLKGDTLYLDSLSVVPNTVAVRDVAGQPIDSNAYEVKAFQSILVWKQKPAGDSVKVFFRVYPFSLGHESYHKSYSAYKEYSSSSLVRPFVYKPDEPGFKLIDFGNLDYNGTFSRSVSFGSNQSVVLNSNFNLQLSGMLTRDLEITAAITDNSIPIQPEGNTQQVQEFDKIFIQLRKDRHKVIVGDFDLFNPQREYFLRFSKKYQGGYYSGEFDIKKTGVIRTAVAGGISRGKFSRNLLTVSEGNQGPYKLTGANGETFIIILANTEEVFINGKKMERGADRDYVIDYNLGEITFMPRRIITKDLRVYVEFEYTERNYVRSTAFVNTEFEAKKGNIHFNLYSEQDSKGQNVQQSLNADKKTFLTTIGDSIQKAFYRGWDSVAYDANRILYQMKDTTIFPFTFDSIFVYSTDSSKAKYAVSFSLVGQGKGNYVPATSTANGRVYKWVAPLLDTTNFTFIPQGSYEPVIFLVTPKYQQMYTLGGEYLFNSNNKFSADVALSNQDINMYSRKDKGDNLGVAARAAYQSTIVTKTDSMNTRKEFVTLDVNYEFLQNRFNTIERYRNIEFSRDWNILVQEKRYNEHLAAMQASYNWNRLGTIAYHFKAYIQDSVYRGFENGVNGNFSKKGATVVFANSYLYSTSTFNSTNYVRPSADISYGIKKIKGWRIGAAFNHEVNMIKNNNSDTLAANSFLWQNYRVYFNSPDSLRNKFGFEVTVRNEHKPKGQKFDKPFFTGQTVSATGQVNTLKNQTLNYSLTYRHASQNDTVNTSQPEHFYLGRIDYNFTVLKGFIRSTLLYEVGSGRQQKMQLSYQASPTNQGDFVWKDVNGDGIKQVDEFVVSQFKEDTSYIRVFVVTPEFVSVNTNQLNYVLNINPAAVWRNTKGIRKVLAMFSALASVQITKKTFVDPGRNFGEYFNPFPLKKEDARLVSNAISSRNSLYFNRLEAKYGGQLDFNYATSRTLLTTGYENRFMQSQGATVRWNVVKSFNTQFTYTNGIKANQSDYYKQLRYRFSYNDLIADLSYLFKTFLRIGLKYDLSYKVNPTDTVGKQTAQVHKITTEVRYNKTGKNTVNASFSYASIKYADKNYPNQQLEYAMLEGLRNGNNLVWTVGYEQNLGNNIQLSLTYDGRMTGFTAGDKSTLKPVHTGRAELRALF
jgi:hypothetical protein